MCLFRAALYGFGLVLLPKTKELCTFLKRGTCFCDSGSTRWDLLIRKSPNLGSQQVQLDEKRLFHTEGLPANRKRHELLLLSVTVNKSRGFWTTEKLLFQHHRRCCCCCCCCCVSEQSQQLRLVAVRLNHHEESLGILV